MRIFTPSTELPFAGHPTLGSCHAWLRHGGVPAAPGVVVQQCGVGLVTIRQDDDGRLAFAAPPLLRDGPLDPDTLAEAADALGVDVADVVDAAWIDNGPGWLGIRPGLGRGGARPAPPPLAAQDRRGRHAPHRVRHPLRGPRLLPDGTSSFEDPVTGSLQASTAQWLIGSGVVTAPYVTSQGAVLGRAGRVTITTDDTGQVWVGGDVTTCVTGTVEL